MKRVLRPLFLIAILASLLCVSALAKYTYFVPTNTSATISNYSTEKFDVTATPDVTDGSQYLVMVLNEKAVPTENNIIYIDQAAAASGKVSFENVYPTAMELSENRASPDHTYFVYVVGEGRAFNKDAPAATFKFYEDDVLLGDVNNTGEPDINDAVQVLRAVAELVVFDEAQTAAGDVNGNQRIDINDAVQILRYVAELIDSF